MNIPWPFFLNVPKRTTSNKLGWIAQNYQASISNCLKEHQNFEMHFITQNNPKD
jgi:hypothetical protein